LNLSPFAPIRVSRERLLRRYCAVEASDFLVVETAFEQPSTWETPSCRFLPLKPACLVCHGVPFLPA
jgi:hypothetical protein